jgi:hypothetical protein
LVVGVERRAVIDGDGGGGWVVVVEVTMTVTMTMTMAMASDQKTTGPRTEDNDGL